MENLKYKGTYDLLPPDMERFRTIEKEFTKTCLSWRYSEIKTPTLEYLYLFTSAGTLTPAKLNRVYSFLDWDGWSGERVALRPDGTIPVARLYIENMSTEKIARLFYITNVFSFDSTGKENRERWQCGIEHLGSNKPLSDVETILVAKETLNNLGLDDIQIKLSHAGLLKTLFKELKLDSENEDRLLHKISSGKWDEVKKLKKESYFVNNIFSLLLNTKGKRTAFLENIKSLPGISPKIIAVLNNFIDITKILDSINLEYQIDIATAGDFEYYTGLYFKIIYKNRIVSAGGRYNDLIPLLGGDNIPACGSAIYMDQITKYVNVQPVNKGKNAVSIVLASQSYLCAKIGFELVHKLHSIGFIAFIREGPTGYQSDWSVNINRTGSTFTIFDNTKYTKTKALSLNEVIKVIRKA
jgi:histidyl-tRNA synthetase